MSRTITATLVLATAGLLAAGQAAPAAAQVVRGALVEQAAGTPLPGAAVALLDSTGTAVDSTRAAADGSFMLRAPAAGVYALYFSHPGYASVPSIGIRVAAGESVEHRFAVPLISGAAIRRMAEVIDLEQRLQSSLTELCGEPLRSWEAGMLVGVVRQRGDGRPLAGAIVGVAAVHDGAEPFRKATVTSANGVYVICNVPVGEATLRTEHVGYRVDEGPVEVRAGNIGWYDIMLRR
jgi:hypothetical protein